MDAPEVVGSGLGFLFICFMGLIGLAITAFWIWMIVDCATKEEEGSNKIVWILVVVLLGWLGALIYLFVRKLPRGRATAGY